MTSTGALGGSELATSQYILIEIAPLRADMLRIKWMIGAVVTGPLSFLVNTFSCPETAWASSPPRRRFHTARQAARQRHRARTHESTRILMPASALRHRRETEHPGPTRDGADRSRFVLGRRRAPVYEKGNADTFSFALPEHAAVGSPPIRWALLGVASPRFGGSC